MARAYGLVLDPWQENVLQAACGLRSDGRWAATTVGVNVARQNGKGSIIEARELAGLLLFGEKTIIHSAHLQQTARVGFERLLAYFENFDDLRKKVRGHGVMNAISREYIKLSNGSEIHFPARSKGAIRGWSIDCLILDEAQILGDPAWEAMKPTISARPNVQTWMLGTAPTPLDDSAVFMRQRERAKKGADQRLAWCEWSAEHGSDLDDRDVWAQANPALGVRIREEAVEDELAEMSADGFARERLSIWPLGQAGGLFGPGVWHALARATPEPRIAFALGVAADVDQTRLSLGAVLKSDCPHLGSVLRMPADDRALFVAEVVRVQDEQGCPLLIDKRGPASFLIDDLREGGAVLTIVGLDEVVQAEADLVHAVESGQVEHGDYDDLNAAVDAAGWRTVGDRRAFARRLGDVSALEAVALAAWGALNSNYDPMESVL